MFGINLRAIRKELKLTQDAFAKNVGVSGSYISDIEKGKGNPSEPVIRLLEIIYRANRDYLVFGEGPMFRVQNARMDLGAISKEQAEANRAREESASLYNDRDRVEKGVPDQALKDRLIQTQESLIRTQGDLITQLKTRLTRIEEKLQALNEERKKIVKENQGIKQRLKAAEDRIRLGDPEYQREEILKKRAM